MCTKSYVCEIVFNIPSQTTEKNKKKGDPHPTLNMHKLCLVHLKKLDKFTVFINARIIIFNQ